MTSIVAFFGALRPGNSVVGWKLDPEQRREMLERFPPRYSQVVADHVTLRAKVAGDSPLPPHASARITGRADDDNGVEALVVSIDGSTDRPDGGTYHVTWSLSPGRRAKESNDVIARRGWAAIAEGIALELEPARFR